MSHLGDCVLNEVCCVHNEPWEEVLYLFTPEISNRSLRVSISRHRLPYRLSMIPLISHIVYDIRQGRIDIGHTSMIEVADEACIGSHLGQHPYCVGDVEGGP